MYNYSRYNGDFIALNDRAYFMYFINKMKSAIFELCYFLEREKQYE